MNATPVTLHGKAYIILERDEYEAMKTAQKVASLPPFPQRDEKGLYPAAEAIRVSIARRLIQDRTQANLTQKELANRAGIRVETLCRIETGKHSPNVATVDRIEQALLSVSKRKKSTRQKKVPK
jgi:DNA-binding XRE family transcriptional regulator